MQIFGCYHSHVKEILTAGANWRKGYLLVQTLMMFLMSSIKVDVKVVPYTFVRRGVPVREDTHPEPYACEA